MHWALPFAVAFTACQDNLVDKSSNPAGKGAAVGTANLGLPGSTRFQVDTQGNVIVNHDITLDADTTYILHNYFRVQSGFKITIEPGTVIKGVKKATTANDIATGTLVIERGAQIDAQGTSCNPIVFTSNKAIPAPGDWGGIVILGKADVNLLGSRGASPSGTDGLGFIEGLPTPTNNGRYGNGDLAAGSYNTDNSGIMRYVVIAYAGELIGTANELNGLTLGGVGSGTTLEYIEVYKGFDDGFEFFGGTVNANHLVSALNADDDFDTDQGYSGKIQFAVVVREPNASYLADLPLTGSETNGDNDDDITGKPLTSAQFSNFTFIGPYQNNCGETTLDADYRAGVYFRDLSAQDVFNSVIVGFLTVLNSAPKVEYLCLILLQLLSATLTDIRNTTIVVPSQASVIAGVTTNSATWDDFTSTNWNTAFLTSGLSNTILAASSCSETSPLDMASRVGFDNAAWTGDDNVMPVLNPLSGSALLTGGSFTGLSGFSTVAYRGAFDASNNWMACWTKWQD